eukprot:7380091-Prymnesium_polylepis.1
MQMQRNLRPAIRGDGAMQSSPAVLWQLTTLMAAHKRKRLTRRLGTQRHLRVATLRALQRGAQASHLLV